MCLLRLLTSLAARQTRAGSGEGLCGSNYHPDFFVEVAEKRVWLVETKGREDLDDPRKYERLKQWSDIVFDCLTVRHRTGRV